MNPSYITTGVAGGKTIQTDIANGVGSAVPVAVTLSEDYVLASPRPPGFHSRPSMTGAAAGNLDRPGATILSGSQIFLLACEAAALIDAGVASYSDVTPLKPQDAAPVTPGTTYGETRRLFGYLVSWRYAADPMYYPLTIGSLGADNPPTWYRVPVYWDAVDQDGTTRTVTFTNAVLETFDGSIISGPVVLPREQALAIANLNAGTYA